MNARLLAPYGVAVGGAVAVTAAIGLVTALASVSGLSAVYVLLVLWLGARWGRGPAMAGSVAAFLMYDFFFVPPVGTFSVRGPSELLELVVLLAVALVTSQLAASLRRTQASAEAMATRSQALYELAIAALQAPEVANALSLLCGRAAAIPGVKRFAIAAVVDGKGETLAGDTFSADELGQAVRSFETRRPVGISV